MSDADLEAHSAVLTRDSEVGFAQRRDTFEQSVLTVAITVERVERITLILRGMAC
ncbi:MAG TPA: hypothetical protein VFG30_07375 [Polyangiales bacterium]|nr:hypothetical protein [Polyangiales bacterium]